MISVSSCIIAVVLLILINGGKVKGSIGHHENG
jgi:hypothetical protein